MVELACVAPLRATVERIRNRTQTTSQVTPDIAADMALGGDGTWAEAKVLNTTEPLPETLDAAQDLCRQPTTRGDL